MNTEQIEDKIVSALKAIPSQFQPNARNREWTKGYSSSNWHVRKKNLAMKYADFLEHFQAAWLFDLCWYSSSPAPDGKLINMPLALESEWDVKYAGIKYDFEKLLIAKSKFKVLVFQAKDQTVTEYFKEFEQGIRAYQGGKCGRDLFISLLRRKKVGFLKLNELREPDTSYSTSGQ